METSSRSGSTRLKVLVAAYACSPIRGSESGVGWGWVEAISKYHDLWVLTGAHCKEEIEAELSKRPELREHLRFQYIVRTQYKWAERLWPPAYLYTYKHQWQKAALEIATRLHDQIHFDVVHQMTYVGFRVPGFLWQLNAPFAWGPIGGLEQTTLALMPALGLKGSLYFAARNLINDWDKRFSRAAKRAFAKADGGIIAATAGVGKEIRRKYGYDSTIISEIGVPPANRKTLTRRLGGEPLSLLWCGNHLPGKALPFLLTALRMLPANLNWKLSILGSGPCSKEWQRLASKNGIAHRCEWLGQVSRSTVLEMMQTAHVMVITSVYDLTSTVLVEALTSGLPVICPDHCGFADAITPACGIKVPATSSHALIEGLRSGIVQLDDEDVRQRLADGALKRSAAYEWDLKARAVSEIYRRKTQRLQDRTLVTIEALTGTD